MALKSKLGDFARGIREAIDAGVEEAAKDVRDLASQLVPVDSGDLKGTIKVEPRQNDGERIVSAGGDEAPYGIYVEYGNSNPNYPAQPFMTPAAENIRVAFRVAPKLKELERQSKV